MYLFIKNHICRIKDYTTNNNTTKNERIKILSNNSLFLTWLAHVDQLANIIKYCCKSRV